MAIQLEVDQQPPPSIKEMHTSDHDLEKSGPGASDSEKAISIRVPGPKTESLDIEHVPVQNDPRKWSSFRKVSSLTQAPSRVLHHFFYYSMLPWH